MICIKREVFEEIFSAATFKSDKNYSNSLRLNKPKKP
jgi:hypothetical protein